MHSITQVFTNLYSLHFSKQFSISFFTVSNHVTGLVKILKKHDKLSGALLRVPFIQKVMNEPFYKTDVLNNLVKKCEMMLDQFLSTKQQSSSPSESGNRKEGRSSEPNEESSSVRVPEELVDIENRENTYMKQTLSALRVLSEIRNGSSTVNSFSLPPMQQNKEREEVWKKTYVVEEVAK